MPSNIIRHNYEYNQNTLINIIKDNDQRRSLIKRKTGSEIIIDAFHGETGILMYEPVREKLLEKQKLILSSSSRPLHNKGQPGPDILRELACENLFYRLKEHNVSVSKNDILICEQSSTHWLDHAISSLGKTKYNPALLCPEGFYKSNGKHASANDVRLIPVPVNSQYKLDADTLDKYYSLNESSVCGLLLTDPGNPFLLDYSYAELSAIAEVVLAKDMRVINDAVFQEMHPGHIPFSSICIEHEGHQHHMKDRTATIASISKGHNAPGTYKIGALLCHNDTWRQEISDLHPQNIQREATMLAAIILEETPKKYFMSNRDLMKEQKTRTLEIIKGINKKYSHPISNGHMGKNDTISIVGHHDYGMFACITLAQEVMDRAEIEDSLQLCEFLLADAGIDSVALARTGAELSEDSQVPPSVRLNIIAPGYQHQGQRIIDKNLLGEMFRRIEKSIDNINDGLTYTEALSRIGIHEKVSLHNYTFSHNFIQESQKYHSH